MQVKNELFAVPATYTNRSRTVNERINPTTVVADDQAAGDVIFLFLPAAQVYLAYRVFAWTWKLPSSLER